MEKIEISHSTNTRLINESVNSTCTCYACAACFACIVFLPVTGIVLAAAVEPGLLTIEYN